MTALYPNFKKKLESQHDCVLSKKKFKKNWESQHDRVITKCDI